MLILKILQVRHERKELGQRWRNKINTWFQATIAHIHIRRPPNLRQLFEGPSQFEESGDFAALRVVLARAPCLYKRRHQRSFFSCCATKKKKTLKKRRPPPHPHHPSTFQTRWMEFNEEFSLACCLHNGLDSLKLDPGPLYTSIHICATQIYDRTVSVRGRDSTNFRLCPQDLFWQRAVTPLQPQTWRRQVNDRWWRCRLCNLAADKWVKFIHIHIHTHTLLMGQ